MLGRGRRNLSRERLLAESKDYDDFTDKAIAYGKLTGDFTIDRHILPQPTGAEIDAEVLRLQAEYPERLMTREQLDALSEGGGLIVTIDAYGWAFL